MKLKCVCVCALPTIANDFSYFGKFWACGSHKWYNFAEFSWKIDQIKFGRKIDWDARTEVDEKFSR